MIDPVDEYTELEGRELKLITKKAWSLTMRTRSRSWRNGRPRLRF